MGQILKINCDSTPYFGGLGDTVLLTWLAEAAKQTENEIELWAGGGVRKYLLELLNAPIAKTFDKAVMPSGCYNVELADQGKRPRWEYAADFLGIKTGIKRPTANVPPLFQEWAKEERIKIQSKGNPNGPFVVLFPQTHWQPRMWPQSHWLFLAVQLRSAGINSIFMLDHQDQRFTLANQPITSYWGFSLGQVAAMMQVADCVIGNDSFPAHFAGTLGCKTIALMGPTKPTVFSHCPNVRCMQTTRQPCVGCHFSQPFSFACDMACSALLGITPHDVLTAIKEEIE